MYSQVDLLQVVKLLGIIGNAACRLQLALSADCQPGSLSWPRSLFHSPLPAVTRLSSTRSADEDHTHPAHSHMQAGTVSEAQSVSAVLCVIGKSGKRKSRLAKHNAYSPCGMKGGRSGRRGGAVGEANVFN